MTAVCSKIRIIYAVMPIAMLRRIAARPDGPPSLVVSLYWTAAVTAERRGLHVTAQAKITNGRPIMHPDGVFYEGLCAVDPTASHISRIGRSK